VKELQALGIYVKMGANVESGFEPSMDGANGNGAEE
jgi:hypothetical protein